MDRNIPRRGFAGLSVSAALAGCTDQLNEITGGLGGGVIRSTEWKDGGVLEVTYADEHDAEFIALVHEFDDSMVLWADDAPRFAGPIEVPIYTAIACDDSEYPTNTFELVTGIGTTSFGLVEEILEREELEVSDQRLDEAQAQSPEQVDCFSIGMQ